MFSEMCDDRNLAVLWYYVAT